MPPPTATAGLTNENNQEINDAAKEYVFVRKWGSSGTGDGQLDGSEGIAIDSSGNVYEADSPSNRIQKFDSNGKFITKWGSDWSFPYGVAIDSSDKVYVTDYFNARIHKFDSNGKFITKWGSQGTGDGQFDSPVVLL